MAYRFKDELDVWAAKALDKAGYGVARVYNVFPPLDIGGGEVEVDYLNGKHEPKTAILTPTGDVLRVHTGWGE